MTKCVNVSVSIAAAAFGTTALIGCGSDSQGASGDTSGGTSGGTAKKPPLKSQEESEPVPGSRQDVGHEQESQEERQRKAVSGSPKAKQQSGGTGAVSHHSPPTAAKLSTTPVSPTSTSTPAAATANNLSCNNPAAATMPRSCFFDVTPDDEPSRQGVANQQRMSSPLLTAAIKAEN